MSAEPAHSTNPRPVFISTAPARALLAPLEHGFGARAPFLLITGDTGTGKSMLAAEAIRRWGERAETVVLPATLPEPAALASTLLQLFGGNSREGANTALEFSRLLNALANATAGGRVAVLLVDDAHTLTPEHVQELHRIAEAAAHRQCPLELLLVGLPALADMFAVPPLDALERRVAVRGELSPLSANDTREYLMLRPNSAGRPSAGLYSRKSCRDIHSASLGVLATVEALAAESMRRALRGGVPTVSPEHVLAAANALRAGRAEDAAHTLPPRRPRATPAAERERPPEEPAAPVVSSRPRGNKMQSSRPADEAAPERPERPAIAPATAPETAPAAAPASRGPAPALPSSSATASSATPRDQRVQEWLARFGGSGVRIGAQVPRRMPDEREPLDGMPIQMRAETPQAPPTRPVGPIEPKVEIALDPAELAETVRKDEAVELARRSTAPRDADPRTGIGVVPPPHEPRGATKMPSLVLVLVLVFTALALLVSQADSLRKTWPAAAAKLSAIASLITPHEHVAPATSTLPVKPPPRPAPAIDATAQYSIAVGSYPTRDMARAECDYLGRLVPMSVRVAPAGVGKRGFRLLLGRFENSSAAEVSAHRLVVRGLVPEANVLAVPRAPRDSAAKTSRR